MQGAPNSSPVTPRRRVYLGRETRWMVTLPANCWLVATAGALIFRIVNVKAPMTATNARPPRPVTATKATLAGKPPVDPTPVHAALQHFDKLPDSACARVPVVAALFSISVPTAWRWARAGRLPTPTKRGGVTTFNVGALRRAMAQSDSTDTTRTASATAAATAKRATAPAV